MAKSGAWSNSKSEAENEILENEEIRENELEDFYYNELQLFDNVHYYPAIKDFEGSSKINPDRSFSGNKQIDYFNYFCDSSLLQKIVNR